MREEFFEQILQKIILQHLEIHGFHQVTQEASDILVDVVKAFIYNLAHSVSQTLTHTNRTPPPSLPDILHSLSSLYAITLPNLIEFLLYSQLTYSELPKVEFDFFKRVVVDDDGVPALIAPTKADNHTISEATSAVVASVPTPTLTHTHHPHTEYDYTDVEFTNKRRSKLIPILQQQQSDVLPFYLPSFPRVLNAIKENSTDAATNVDKSQQQTDDNITTTENQEQSTEDLNVLEIQQRVIDSYRRRGKKRKRKPNKGALKVNPYMQFVSEA